MDRLETSPLRLAALCYLALINLVTFCLYGIDKRKARRGKWRIPETTLFIFPLLGGSAGALLGMQLFHHKTKHRHFKFGIPTILLCQIALGIYLYSRVKL